MHTYEQKGETNKATVSQGKTKTRKLNTNKTATNSEIGSSFYIKSTTFISTTQIFYVIIVICYITYNNLRGCANLKKKTKESKSIVRAKKKQRQFKC
jgi:hypothetical protein